MQAFATDYIAGVHRYTGKGVVQIFDLDDTLTLKPEGFDNRGMTKDQFFDASRDFPHDPGVVHLLKLMFGWGDAIAICTSRPVSRLTESWQWLRKHNIPFDCLIHSKEVVASGIAKQYMIKHLQSHYSRIGTLFDDSPYNVRGARLQKIGAVHIRKNDLYWAQHPEEVYKV